MKHEILRVSAPLKKRFGFEISVLFGQKSQRMCDRFDPVPGYESLKKKKQVRVRG